MKPVIIDYNAYLERNNVSRIIESLNNKGVDIIKKVPLDEVIYLDEWNSNVFELYSADTSKEVNELFADEHQYFSKLENLERVLYMFVDPNQEVLEHVDEDDTNTYRILVGVHGEGEFSNINQNETKVLTYNTALGIDVEVEPHKGKNLSNSIWAVLIICIHKKYYN